MFCDSGFAGKLARMFACLLLPILLSPMAWADTIRVFVEAPGGRIFLPYGLGQAVPLADSGFHRVPGCVLAPEFETACRTFGAFDISRAFALASDADTIRYNPSGEPINVSFMRNWYVVRVPDTISVDAMVSVLKDSLGLWAEPPMGAAPNSAQTLEPQDPEYYTHQRLYLGYGNISGKWAHMLELPKAWAIHTGDPGVKIGVFDYGVVSDHPDMDGKPISGDPWYSSPHGTMVAAIIYGDVNDANGPTAGINWNASRAAYLVLDGNNAENTNTLERAWTDGCQFINCSFRLCSPCPNTRVYSALFHEAAASVRMAGGIIIAGAGNTGTGGNLDESPADLPEAISVAAINKRAERWPESTAREWVDFAAPGDSVWVAHWHSHVPGFDTLPWYPYDGGPLTEYDSIVSGTSFAAAHVTGIASLLYSYALTQGYTLNDEDDICNLLRFSADPLLRPPGWNEETGWGMPKLDSAYWLVTKPNTVARYDVQGGWTETQTGVYGCKASGILGLTYSVYLVRRHDLQRWQAYPEQYYAVYGTWVRGRSSVGAGIEARIVPTHSGKVLEWNNDQCLVQTSWYEIWDLAGNPVGVWPTTTAGAMLKLSVVGEKRIIRPAMSASLNDPAKVTVYWSDPNEIEQQQRLYRKVSGTTTYYSVPLGSGSRDFADTLASTPYKYWMNVWNVHQNILSDTLVVRHPPRSPDNIQATVILGDPTLIHFPKVTSDHPDSVPTNKVRISWQHSPSQPLGTRQCYSVQKAVPHCAWYPCPGGPYCWVCDTTWDNYPISASRTDTTLCMAKNTTYAFRVVAIDIYGDTNVVRP